MLKTNISFVEGQTGHRPNNCLQLHFDTIPLKVHPLSKHVGVNVLVYMYVRHHCIVKQQAYVNALSSTLPNILVVQKNTHDGLTCIKYAGISYHDKSSKHQADNSQSHRTETWCGMITQVKEIKRETLV